MPVKKQIDWIIPKHKILRSHWSLWNRNIKSIVRNTRWLNLESLSKIAFLSLIRQDSRCSQLGTGSKAPGRRTRITKTKTSSLAKASKRRRDDNTPCTPILPVPGNRESSTILAKIIRNIPFGCSKNRRNMLCSVAFTTDATKIQLSESIVFHRDE